MMLSNTIIESDKFLDLPVSTRFLYIFLNSQADGMGFITNKKAIIRTLGLDENGNDLQALIDAGYIIEFKQSGVICIKHWHAHNTDLRKKTTDCCEEFEQLEVGKRTGEYFFKGNVPEIEQKPAYEPKIKMIDEEEPAEDQEQQPAIDASRPDQQEGGETIESEYTLEDVKRIIEEENLKNINAEEFFEEWKRKNWRTNNGKGEQIRSLSAFMKALSKQESDKRFNAAAKEYQRLKPNKHGQTPAIEDLGKATSDQPAEALKGGYDMLEDADYIFADHNGF